MAHGEGLFRQAQVQPYRRRRGDPLVRPLKVFTIDSTTARSDGAIATVETPWEPLMPGPIGRLLAVERLDVRGKPVAVDLEDPRILIQGGVEPSVSDPRFHQQMLYAVCSKIYAQFQAALGRSVAWGFDSGARGGRLLLRPHAAEAGRNAMYEKGSGQISFGFFPAPAGGMGRHAPNGQVFTCLSHDIIAHELTHALIDGLRSNFTIPTSNDVLGFHEGFADLIALLQHFTYREAVASQLRRFEGNLDQAAMLANIAEEFGLTTQGKALRCALSPELIPYRPDMEAHEMGAVLLRAVFSAFRRIYQRKTESYLRLAYRPPSGLLVSELVEFLAAKASELASHFLIMCIRAIDYCPPVDLQLGEFLRALVTADHELVPNDSWGYRDELIRAFAEHGIYPPGVSQLSEDSLMWRPPERPMPAVHALHFANLRFAGDPSLPAGRGEVERQAHALFAFITMPHLADEFGLASGSESGVQECCVESIRTSRRVGPDGQVLFDLVAEVTQRRVVSDPRTGIATEFLGGSTLIVGPEGEIRYVISKNVSNAERLARQLAYQRESSQYWATEGGAYRSRGDTHELAHWRETHG